MKHIYTFILTAALLTLSACQKHIDIQGSTSIPALDDRMLYLRIYEDGDLTVIDSTRITHGKFHFTGVDVDSTVMANLFLNDESIMPVVIEPGIPLVITIDENERRVEGSALNDTLFAFIRRKSALDQQLADLPHRESQMILEGIDHGLILSQLNQEAAALGQQEDDLVMGFIKQNMNNVLGTGVFMILTSGFPYPMLNPRLEELVTLASPYFLADPYVQEFLRLAHENMEMMNEEE